MDADLTNSVAPATIGVSLLVLNVLMIIIIMVGAKETVRRASQLGKHATRRLSTAFVRRGSSAVTSSRNPGDIELATVYSSSLEPSSREDGGAPGAIAFENPLRSPQLGRPRQEPRAQVQGE